MKKRRSNDEAKAAMICRVTIDTATGCWNWDKPRSAGYGRFIVDGRPMSAHRAAYFLFVGDVSEDHHVDHLCRNRACVNPAHLEAVPPRVNLLRGEGAPAKNARKSHCKRGHPFDLLNTLIDANGKRACRACANERSKEHQKAKRRADPKFGLGPGGYNRIKTHCRHGHPFDAGNTYLSPSGERQCRTCQREKERRRLGITPDRYRVK